MRTHIPGRLVDIKGSRANSSGRAGSIWETPFGTVANTANTLYPKILLEFLRVFKSNLP